MAENEQNKIDGRYPDMARAIRTLLEQNDIISSREAFRKTGINHATITTMLRGDRPSDGTLIKFASALGTNPFELLELAGYSPENYRLRTIFKDMLTEALQRAVTALENRNKEASGLLAEAGIFTVMDGYQPIAENVMFRKRNEKGWDVASVLTYTPECFSGKNMDDLVDDLIKVAEQRAN